MPKNSLGEPCRFSLQTAPEVVHWRVVPLFTWTVYWKGETWCLPFLWYDRDSYFVVFSFVFVVEVVNSKYSIVVKRSPRLMPQKAFIANSRNENLRFGNMKDRAFSKIIKAPYHMLRSWFDWHIRPFFLYFLPQGKFIYKIVGLLAGTCWKRISSKVLFTENG